MVYIFFQIDLPDGFWQDWFVAYKHQFSMKMKVVDPGCDELSPKCVWIWIFSNFSQLLQWPLKTYIAINIKLMLNKVKADVNMIYIEV